MSVADLNGDGRPDVVEAQGEVAGHEDERVYLGSEVLSPDTAPPDIRMEVIGSVVVARVHDNRTPNMPHDWQSVAVRWDGGETAMMWYGENLFRAVLPQSVTAAQICASDAAGNDACSSRARVWPQRLVRSVPERCGTMQSSYPLSLSTNTRP